MGPSYIRCKISDYKHAHTSVQCSLECSVSSAGVVLPQACINTKLLNVHVQVKSLNPCFIKPLVPMLIFVLVHVFCVKNVHAIPWYVQYRQLYLQIPKHSPVTLLHVQENVFAI